MSRVLERARSLLDRPGAWLDQSGAAYPLRLGGDRRGRGRGWAARGPAGHGHRQ